MIDENGSNNIIKSLDIERYDKYVQTIDDIFSGHAYHPNPLYDIAHTSTKGLKDNIISKWSIDPVPAILSREQNRWCVSISYDRITWEEVGTVTDLDDIIRSADDLERYQFHVYTLGGTGKELFKDDGRYFYGQETFFPYHFKLVISTANTTRKEKETIKVSIPLDNTLQCKDRIRRIAIYIYDGKLISFDEAKRLYYHERVSSVCCEFPVKRIRVEEDSKGFHIYGEGIYLGDIEYVPFKGSFFDIFKIIVDKNAVIKMKCFITIGKHFYLTKEEYENPDCFNPSVDDPFNLGYPKWSDGRPPKITLDIYYDASMVR